LRRTDTIALALWIASVALVVIAAVAGPDGQCDYDNHDTYVVEAHRAGYVLLAAAVTMTGAQQRFWSRVRSAAEPVARGFCT
jgi:hypothetical protein